MWLVVDMVVLTTNKKELELAKWNGDVGDNRIRTGNQ